MMNPLYCSTIITCLLMFLLLAMMFFRMDFKHSTKPGLLKKAFRLLALATITTTIITGIVGFASNPNNTSTPITVLSSH
ncbi:MAG: hypothetical protein JWO06_2734 [Bacteroidota bacterium]|nr:hypothetical protein [Bacteroidota bacterium]